MLFFGTIQYWPIPNHPNLFNTDEIYKEIFKNDIFVKNQFSMRIP